MRKKTFAYYLENHPGDGSSRFYLPSYIGPSGWVGLRLDVEEVDWEEVAEYALGSYRHYAPKKLAAMIES